MSANRIPRKLKKKIIKELDRDSYKEFVSDSNITFQKEIYSEMTNNGWKHTCTGKYKLMYKIEDGRNN